MQVVRGIAHNVRQVEIRPKEPAICLQLDDRTVRIWGKEELLAVRDGDEILVSGTRKADNILDADAYKNYTRGYVRNIGRLEENFAYVWVCLVLISAAIWNAQAVHDVSAPSALPHWMDSAIGISLAMVGSVFPLLYLCLVIGNCVAELRLMRASIEVVCGIVRRIEEFVDFDPRRTLTLHHVHMDVDGRVVDFKAFNKVPISEGDEVIIAGAGDFTGINVIYRNLTKSLRSPDWSLTRLGRRLASDIAWVVILVVTIILLWSWGYPGNLNVEFAARRVLALGLMAFVVKATVRAAFQWRFLPELARLVRAPKSCAQ